MDPEIDFPYSATQLTDQINRVPNLYGFLRERNLFASEGSISTIVEIRYEDGVLRVLPATERGAPASADERETGKTVFLKVPHFPALDLITAKDIQDWNVISARQKRPGTFEEMLAKRLVTIRGNHAITLEYVRNGAIKGIIRDGKGAVLHNLFTTFDIQKKEVDFVLGTAGTDIIAKCEEVTDHILTNLKGETSNGIEIMVSSSFFNKLVQHPKVEKHWMNWQAAGNIANMTRDTAGQNWGRRFTFQNLDFVENKTTFPVKSAGVSVSEAAVAAGYGHAYPLGTQQTFKTWFAPADDIRFVNTPGEEIYVSPEILKHGEGVELKNESNPLAVCTRPELLVEVRTSN